MGKGHRSQMSADCKSHREDPLGGSLATHSSILAQTIPWTEEPDGLRPWGRQESDMTEATEHAHMQTSAAANRTLRSLFLSQISGQSCFKKMIHLHQSHLDGYYNVGYWVPLQAYLIRIFRNGT